MFMCHAAVHRPIPKALFLSHFEGADQATYFVDECLNYASTFYGNGNLDTSRKRFGTSSVRFAANQARATTNLPTAVATGDYTIEFFVYHEDGAAAYSRYLTTTYPYDSSIRRQGNVYHTYDYPAGGVTAQSLSGPVVQMNTWVHIAKVRYNGVVTLYINGAAAGSYINTEPVGFKNITIGNAGVEWFTGNIDEIRILLHAAYTSDFAPPTSPFSAF